MIGEATMFRHACLILLLGAALLGQHAGHGIEACFAGGVDRVSGRMRARGTGADIDDASRRGSEVWERFADDQQWPEQVDVDLAVELLLDQFRDRHRLIDSGIVDQNVERAEGSLRPLKKPGDIGGLRDIRLDTPGRRW